MGWKVVLDYDISGDRERLFIFRRDIPSGRGYFVDEFSLTAVEEGGLRRPAMVETAEWSQDGFPSIRQFMQAVVDEAWSHGIRPTGIEDFTNELKAVRYHLEDMRELAKVGKRRQGRGQDS